MSRKPTAPRKPRIYGPEPWRTLGSEDFTCWDLWYLVVLMNDHAGDWASLETTLADPAKDKIAGYERDDAEAKLSHLEDLRARLDRSGLTPTEALRGEAIDKRILAKARDKLFRQVADKKTEAMRRTPSRLLRDRAMTGHWASFPADPIPFYDEFVDEIEEWRFYSWRHTMGLADRLEDILRDQAEANDGDSPRVPPRRADGSRPRVQESRRFRRLPRHAG